MQIITTDEIFGRMIYRILESQGFGNLSVVPAAVGTPERAIVDLDSADCPPAATVCCLTISKSRRKNPDLIRPFPEGSLRHLAQDVFGPPDAEEADIDHFSPRLSGGERRSDLPVPTERGVRYSGREIPLSPRERMLYELLFVHRGETLTKEALRDAVFGGSDGNAVEVYISYLRRKLETLTERKLIRTVRGKGYTLRP